MTLLYRDVRTLGEDFPDFFVIGTSVLDECYARHCVDAVLAELPELPLAHTVPSAVSRIGTMLAPIFGEFLAERIDRPTSVRTSIVWPDTEASRLPGLDNTLVTKSWTPGTCEVQIAALYKAYTTMCFNLRGIPSSAPRRAGMIVMDLVPNLRWQGTAYHSDDDLIVELARCQSSEIPRIYRSRQELRSSGPLGMYTADRLCDLLTDLALMVPHAPTQAVEFEFLIDVTDRTLILQRRALPRNAAIFHTPGTYDGAIVDLRRVNRANVVDVDRYIATCEHRAAMVHLLSDTYLDAFTLAWRLQVTGAPPPAAVILVAEPGSRSGMPTHLPWMLREALPETLFVVHQRELRAIPDIVTECNLNSDGIHADVRYL